MYRTGQHGDYRWIEVPYCSTPLLDRAIYCHPGSVCCLVAHDGVGPDSHWSPAGWTELPHALISPPLVEGLDLALGDDHPIEWYIFDRPPARDWRPALFSRHYHFSLAAVGDLVAEQDPTWDRKAHDWLIPLQEEFWDQIDQLGPVSYVLRGATDIVVSRCRKFIKHLPGDD